ncbi:DNA-processing protein DprA [Coraliomargarita sp. SDUM461004]|uniref:DNA-processing protein DprA n=1 Tax=Thalassobacterium sedimentorum TaxID=3041258 RepID=A0ABU1AFA1_9BACT|nr:DNA-processing protein DprA [Coraliomargarita sp. SDUM461004]MDQ8193475.1 DNA-processing protein DprA [Coraliomargarita sp. SDUM461004]
MSAQLNHRQALLVLNGLQHVGPIMLRRLLDAFDHDPVAVLAGNRQKLMQVKGVGDKAATVLTQWTEHFDLSKEVERMKASSVRFLAQTDPHFPAMLQEMYDPPIGLYWKGSYNIDRPCIAIVGTRRATLYGRTIARKFAAELSRLGFCIVSGMARGTDTAAHEGALEAGGKTVAVLGCGLDIVYPPENLELYKCIADTGAVASEFPFGRRADRQTFPMRNRVVAGMCEAVIVIESDVAGGSMITARFAGEQGRQIMALPGRVDQASSAGCHQLIRDGATMVTSVDDILEELRYKRPAQSEPELALGEATSQVVLSELEQEILDCFVGGELCSPDQISQQLNRVAPEVSATLMGLEIKRLVVKRADGRFEAR